MATDTEVGIRKYANVMQKNEVLLYKRFNFQWLRSIFWRAGLGGRRTEQKKKKKKTHRHGKLW